MAHWGHLFDEFTFNAECRNDLVVLHLSERDPTAYEGANRAILQNVLDLAGNIERSEAILVGDGRSYGNGDTTAGFRFIAKNMGIKTDEILTL